ncbi:DUF4265 domain-containing protein [Hymenobacter sp. BT635]|uniref:DUF4265 domain-containing protein n=1 Tax=Hymenobacter nitidus TaxID=2880929 RepID=A0ABS8AAI3_9BACT|nr:DUF4265 domain-containing protein [Hymenobacter nitidus]MCB2376957.1 DUF4265 domain-containing protein [Hymenobacter nitidus]
MTNGEASHSIHNVALVYLEEVDQEYKVEMVDTVKVAEGYKLVSIPFFAKHLALDDVVAVENEDGIHYFDDIIITSGRSVVRIVFFDKKSIEGTISVMQSLGATPYRYFDTVLFAFDIPVTIDYAPIKRFLASESSDDSWSYEEACLGWK